ncbi:MAG: isopentenyl-diphosphate Delta-isomerase [Bacteroidia bacterium]|nr:isopentenyl-diphosphate Delta-isomerase [Bacteroidia bacterium]
METKNVILVDENDVPRGIMEKMEAHRKGELHRAFSIFVFNSNNELLLQRRALNKYHSGGLWTNTCCSHPLPDENIKESAHKRLQEEMGFDCILNNSFHFIYKTELDNGLIEHELDHVFIGHYDNNPIINFEEAMDWKYNSIDEIKQNLKINPEQYTVWFKIIFEKVLENI